MGAVCPRRGDAGPDLRQLVEEEDEQRDLAPPSLTESSGMALRRAPRQRGGQKERQRYMCECHVTHNYFVRRTGMHLQYSGDDAAFLARYSEDIVAAGAVPNEVLAEVKKQREERVQAPAESAARADCIARTYTPLRREVYSLDMASFLAPAFHDVVDALRSAGSAGRSAVAAAVGDLKARGLLEEVRPGLFTLEVFTAHFCELLEEEISHFAASGLPSTAPNWMNRHGVILAELGFDTGFVQPLVRDHLDPLASALLPEHTQGLDSSRAFTVLYDAGEGGDRELAEHYDNAEVTLNVNIGGDWEGGQIAFEGLATEPQDEAQAAVVALTKGRGVLHAGFDLHKALPLTTGRRHNLVIWCRSSKVRNERCPMCFQPPCVRPTSLFGDEGFTVPPCRLSDSSWDPGLADLLFS